MVFVTDLKTPCAIDDAFLEGIAAGMRGAGVQPWSPSSGAGAAADAETVSANEKRFEICAPRSTSARTA